LRWITAVRPTFSQQVKTDGVIRVLGAPGDRYRSVVRVATDLFLRMQRACLGRGPTDSNGSILYFDFSVFSVIWGICFSLNANPNGMKTSDSGTPLAQGTRLLL
jgi:hypothetical protein